MERLGWLVAPVLFLNILALQIFPPASVPKLMIGLAAHLALVWFVFARVDPAAAECQKPNCCLKKALPAPMPASVPVCSSKHHDAWTPSEPPGSSARPVSAASVWKALMCSWLWQWGWAHGTVGRGGRLAATEHLRIRSEDMWPCATAIGLTLRDRQLQRGQQGREGNDVKEMSRIKTGQLSFIRIVVFLNYDFNLLEFMIIITLWEQKQTNIKTIGILVILCYSAQTKQNEETVPYRHKPLTLNGEKGSDCRPLLTHWRTLCIWQNSNKSVKYSTLFKHI